MAWTHSIVGTESTGERLRVLVDYTDGATTVHGEHFTNSAAVDMNWLKGEIVRKLAELSAISTFSASVPTGAIDLTLPTPPTPEEPPLPVIQLSLPISAEGILRTNPVPCVDPTMMCFCQPAANLAISPSGPNTDWQNIYSYVQLCGVDLDITGAAVGDSVSFQVGLMMGGNWVPVSVYGGKILITPTWSLSYSSALRSNPVPQGLVFRIAYTFAGQNPTNTPMVSAMYHMWRPYAG